MVMSLELDKYICDANRLNESQKSGHRNGSLKVNELEKKTENESFANFIYLQINVTKHLCIDRM